MYFASQSVGTLLCQGRDCVFWDKDECEVIKEFISQFMKDNDLEKLSQSLLHTPITFIKLSSGTPTLKLSANGVMEQNNQRPSHGMESSDQSPCSHLLLSSDIAASVELSDHGVRLLPPTPLNSKSEERGDKEVTANLKEPTPVGKRTRKQSRRVLYHTPQRKRTPVQSCQCKKKLNQIEELVDSLTAAQREIENTTACLLQDAKIAAKNELKIHVSDKFQTLQSEINDLKTKISELELKNGQLEKENNSVKTQLGSLRSEMKNLKVKQKQKENACTQTLFKQSVVSPSSSTERPVSESSPVSHSSQVVDLGPSSIVSNSQVCERSSLEGHGATDCLSKDNLVGSDYSDYCTLPTKNSFAVLSNPEISELNHDTEKNTETVSSERRFKDYKSEEKEHEKKDKKDSVYSLSKPSPLEILNRISIPERSTVLLVGDSVVRHINPKRLAPRDERTFKICVPGLTVEDLHSWLLTVPVSANIKDIIVHIGVNNCPSGPVQEEVWADLITQIRKIFPHSSVAMSSIMPAKGRHNLNNSISPSNRSLQSVCSNLGVAYIDNYRTFTSNIGLYHDATHPNGKGTAKLAINLKQVWYNRRHQHQQFQNTLEHHQQVRSAGRCPAGREESVQDSGSRYAKLGSTHYSYSDSVNQPVNSTASSTSYPPPSSVYHYPPLAPDSRHQMVMPPTQRPPPPQYPFKDKGFTSHFPGYGSNYSRPFDITHRETGPHFSRMFPEASTEGTFNPYALHLLNMASHLLSQQHMMPLPRHP